MYDDLSGWLIKLTVELELKVNLFLCFYNCNVKLELQKLFWKVGIAFNNQ